MVGRAVAMIDVSSDASIVAAASAPSTSSNFPLVNPGTIDSVAMTSP